MNDYEKPPNFATYDNQSEELLGDGFYEFNQEIDKEKHESHDALKAKWEREYSRFKDVLATANGDSNPDKKTQDLINGSVDDFGKWGFEFARYGYFLGWKTTTNYLTLAKGFLDLREKVYQYPDGDRDLLQQHLKNLGNLQKSHFPDGDPERKKEEEDDRGRDPILRRTGSG